MPEKSKLFSREGNKEIYSTQKDQRAKLSEKQSAAYWISGRCPLCHIATAGAYQIHKKPTSGYASRFTLYQVPEHGVI